MSLLREREDQLFERWIPYRRGFLRDGAGKDFSNESLRVVFLLKEAVDEIDSDVCAWDLRDYIDSGARWKTWNNVARWAACVLDQSVWSDVVNMPTEKRIGLLRRIAAVNLKKSPGGSISDMNEIYRYSVEDAAWLKEQLMLYEPSLLVTCGTFWIAERLFGFSASNRCKVNGAVFHTDPAIGVLLESPHPQAWGSAKSFFDSLTAKIHGLREAGHLRLEQS